MSASKQSTIWQRWIHHPQSIFLRRAIFQAHLWCGIAIGLYVLMISVTGSVLVYRNELFRLATPPPIISTSSTPRLSDSELSDAATRQHPGYHVMNISRSINPDQAVEVDLRSEEDVLKRLVDPRTGADVGKAIPTGIKLVSFLLDLHDNLLAGQGGRALNGIGAIALIALASTGLAIWWPGIRRWRGSLFVIKRKGWKGTVWHLHSMIGFWTFAFTIVFAISGAYLAFPNWFQEIADRLQPPTDDNVGSRIADEVIYWLAYLHFGRINGIGIPCRGPGVCDQATKAVWALFGLAPAIMFVTGAIMWWNRIVRPRRAINERETEVYRALTRVSG